MVMSAVSCVSTPGVLVTVMPRLEAAATSILSTPLPKLAMSLSWRPACSISAASIRSVTVGTSTSALRIAVDEFFLAHRLVVDIEAGVEKLAHPRLDHVRQLAREDYERFFLDHPASVREPQPVAGRGLHAALTQRNALNKAAKLHGRAKFHRASLADGGPNTRMADRLKPGRPMDFDDIKTAASAVSGDVTRIGQHKLPGYGSSASFCCAGFCRRAFDSRPWLHRQRCEPARPRRRNPRTPTARPIGRVSGLPVPRFVSLKADRVNLREGPSKDHRTTWIYERAGLPVEITAEFGMWRKVRDSGRHRGLGAPQPSLRASDRHCRALEKGHDFHALQPPPQTLRRRSPGCSRGSSAPSKPATATGAKSTATDPTAISTRMFSGASTPMRRSTDARQNAAMWRPA